MSAPLFPFINPCHQEDVRHLIHSVEYFSSKQKKNMFVCVIHCINGMTFVGHNDNRYEKHTESQSCEIAFAMASLELQRHHQYSRANEAMK